MLADRALAHGLDCDLVPASAPRPLKNHAGWSALTTIELDVLARSRLTLLTGEAEPTNDTDDNEEALTS